MIREEVIERIFGIDSDFNSITFLLNLMLLFGERESTCNEELPLNKVKSGDFFWNWMFDLKSCVHFHEVMLVRIEIENELDSTCVIISNSFCGFNSWLTNLRSDWLWNVWWCFLDNFLMSSLDRAISFVQMNIIFHHITENLNFNVTWLCYVFFNQNSVIAEWL